MRPGIVLALAAVACVQPLELPPEPGSGPPVVASVDPPHAYAGAVVTLAGERLQGAEVRFAGSGPVTPNAADSLGKWLQVTVPLDALTGPVTASTSAGRSDGSVVFTSDGAGRLRQGRERATGDLRELVADPAWLAGGGFLALATPSIVLGVVSRASAFAPVAVADAYWRAVSKDGTRLVVLDPPNPSHATMVVDLYDTADFKRIRTIELHPEPGAGTDRPSAVAALTADGRHALVSDGVTAWALDFSATDALEATGRMPAGAWPDGPLVWAGGTRFAVAGTDGVWVLDAGQLASSPEQRSTRLTGHLSYANGLLAAGNVNDAAIELIDMRPTPQPTREVRLSWPGSLAGLALSADGRRLAGLTSTNVWTWDIETGRALGQAAVEAAQGISSTPDGLFVVGGAAGLTLVSAESGEKIAFFPVPAAYVSPVLRHLACLDSEVARDVLLVASRTFGVVDEVDPRTLRRTFCAYPASPPGAAGGLLAYAAPRTGRAAALVAHGDEATVWREPEGGGAGEVWAAGAPAAELSFEGPALAVTPEGTAVVRVRSVPEGPVVAKVASLGGAWPPENPLEISTDGDVVFVAAGPGDRVAYASVAAFVVLDGEKAARGEKAEVFRTAIDEGWEATGLALGARYAVLRLGNVSALTVAAGSRFVVVDARTGMKVADWPVAESSAEEPNSGKTLVLAPGEQRIEWLDIPTDLPQARWLSLELAPDAPTPSILPPFPVPSLALDYASVPEVVFAPDGERVWIVGGTDDRVVQLE